MSKIYSKLREVSGGRSAISLSPKVALSVFRDGCWRFIDVWGVLFRIGDKIFADCLEEGLLDDTDFTKVGDPIVKQLGSETAEELAGYVAAPLGWRRFFLPAMLEIPEFPEPEAQPAAGLRLGLDEEPIAMLGKLAAFATQVGAKQAAGELA